MAKTIIEYKIADLKGLKQRLYSRVQANFERTHYFETILIYARRTRNWEEKANAN